MKFGMWKLSTTLAAFDKTLHPIILSHLYHEGVEDDQWAYFDLLHKNATTHIKWNGKASKEVIKEAIGNRQGGYSSADEWKLYGNPMLKDLEANAVSEGFIANSATNVITVADDVAPCAVADNARDVLHRMQLLLNIVETHGIQNHMEFGKDKCKLLITARPGKLREVQAMLENEPEILTFYDFPLKQVEESYTHIGVPQAPRNQSKHASDYRITKGQNMYYKLQSSTRNTLCGVSPLSNRKVFLSYHQPSYLYGLDTMQINNTDMSKVEVNYRKILKNMLSLPDCVSTPLVYLSVGVLPAEAQRDLDILGLLGQLALSDSDDQNILKVINHNLVFFDEKFGGWSGLVRKTAEKYGLPDPLLYMMNPWRPDRWRAHCRTEIVKFWDSELRNEAEYSKDGDQKSCAIFIDTESLSTTQPMRIWQQAGLSSQAVKEATPVSWMFCGTYFTCELLYKLKKIASHACLCDGSTTEHLSHFLLTRDLYSEIRNRYIPQ